MTFEQFLSLSQKGFRFHFFDLLSKLFQPFSGWSKKEQVNVCVSIKDLCTGTIESLVRDGFDCPAERVVEIVCLYMNERPFTYDEQMIGVMSHSGYDYYDLFAELCKRSFLSGEQQ
jgi:hypothetical protein